MAANFGEWVDRYSAEHRACLARIEEKCKTFDKGIGDLEKRIEKIEDTTIQIREKVFNGLSSTPKLLWAVLTFLLSLMLSGIGAGFALGGKLESIDTTLADHIDHYEAGLDAGND